MGHVKFPKCCVYSLLEMTFFEILIAYFSLVCFVFPLDFLSASDMLTREFFYTEGDIYF